MGAAIDPAATGDDEEGRCHPDDAEQRSDADRTLFDDAPTTTVRITRPSTSSATAAPRTTRASVVASARMSPNTRAVMPTLVAVSAAPRKMDVVVSCPRANRLRHPSRTVR